MSSKIGIVFKFETLRQLKKPSFWVSLLLVPLAIFAIIGLSALGGYNAGSALESGTDLNGKSVGLTNESDLFPSLKNDLNAWFASEDFTEQPTLVEVSSQDEGKQKIINGELDAYYFIPSDVREKRIIKVYQSSSINSIMTDYGIPLNDFISNSTIRKLSEDDQIAIYGLAQFTKVSLNEYGEEENPLGKVIVPIAILAIFYILICVFGNRLSMALVEEKENRISEMILTSVSPKKMVLGKILSLIALGFIQIAVFLIPIAATIFIYRDNEVVSLIFSLIAVEPWMLISNIALLLVSYFFLAGALTFVGSLVPTARDASSYSGIAVILIIMPLFFLENLVAEVPDIVAYILSYFPFSAPIALMIRNAIGNLPTYELIIGIFELAVCSAGILSLTVKSFQKNAINFSVVKPTFGPRKSWKK